MAKIKDYIISETGEFPPQYKVLHREEDGIWRPVFGPDPDLQDAERKCGEMNGERARNAKGQLVADDPSTPDINEAYVGGKKPTKKKTKKPAAKKKAKPKKVASK
tara:strand:- start:170 stop:484 length:315 start_codon:yes stop_codon:yes gene_type:complete